mmetsp:Transcript_55107/g.102034  ORF Transcript_55107/g.102034 Transcript_55107/m.102034 type:complete len:444 (+) Transcript_55107:45-1376(+)
MAATSRLRFALRRCHLGLQMRGLATAEQTGQLSRTSAASLQEATQSAPSSSGGSPLPPHLQAIVDAYDAKAQERALPALLDNNRAGPIGCAIAMAIAYLLHNVDDSNTTLHRVLWPTLLERRDPEGQKQLILRAADSRWLPMDYDKDDPYHIVVTPSGLQFNNPIGLAAGLDTEGVGPVAFFCTGFGSMEVGPVNADSAEELQRFKTRLAGIDRTGATTPSGGLTVEMQLARLGRLGAAVEGSLPNMLKSVKPLSPYLDYISLTVPANLDISSEAVLRDFVQKATLLADGGAHIFLRVCLQDCSDASVARLQGIAAAALSSDAAGLLLSATNCTKQVDVVRDLKRVVHRVYEGTEGSLPILVAADARTAREVIELVEAGAIGVQISGALLKEGPYCCRRLKYEVQGMLRSEAYATLQDAIGRDYRAAKKARRPKNPWARMRGS